MLHPSSLKLIEGEQFNTFCASASDLLASRYTDASINERLNQNLVDEADDVFGSNRTRLLQRLIQLENSGATKEDIAAGLQHFSRFFEAHLNLFNQLAELAETL